MTLAKAITKTLDIDVDDVRIDLTATIKSYDLTDTKFIFDIHSSDGLTIDLTGSTAMYIVEYVHDSQTYAIQGDITVVNSTKISFNLPEDLKGYSGTVLIGIYVKLSDGTKIDIKDIAVRIEPSIMDKDIDFTAKTYFKDFEKVKAEVVLEGEKAKTEIKAVLPSVKAEISEIKTEIENLPDIPDLFVAYANSADGSVDFSRVKPSENLLSNGDFSKGFDNAEIANSSQSNGTIEFVNYNGRDCIKLTNVDSWQVSKYLNLKIGKQNGKVRTLEFDILIRSGSLSVDDGVEALTISSTSSDFVRYKKAIPYTYSRDYIAFYGNNTPVTCYLTNFALHDGDVEIQPFLPSKSDNYRDSFMKYIGYGVKNSVNPSDYRWQVNPEWQRAQLDYEKASMIQDKLVNLISNADFSQGSTGWTGANSTLSVDSGMLKIIGDGTNLGVRAFCEIGFVNSNDIFYMKCDLSTIKGSQNPLSSEIQLRSSDLAISNVVDYNFKDNALSGLFKATKSYRYVFYVLQTYSSASNANGNGFKIDNVVSYNLTSIFGKGNEPSLEEFERLLSINVNSPTIYSQSILKAELNSNPINSILTTLSAENPSTMLGGTWTQLGTETKFDNTIYYWKRTN